MEGCLRKLFDCQGVKCFRIKPTPRVLLGISLCGATGYVLYLLLKNRRGFDDYSDTYILNKHYTKIVMQVPRKYIPYIIGRKGRQIREVENDTHTKISFEREINLEDTCSCTIRGLLECCERAQLAIESIIEEAPVISTESFPVTRAVASNVGKYLENMRFIQELSGSKLWLSENDGNELRIFIKGTVHQIKNASVRVSALIADEQLRLEILEGKLSLRLPRFSSLSDTVPVRHIQQNFETLAPSVSNGLIEVYVSAVQSPSKFVVQIVGPKANELDQLVEQMTEYYVHLESPRITVEVNDIIAAPFDHDEKWYRAKVLKLYAEYAEVYYVDYGDHANVPYEMLRELTAEYMALPYQGIECFLAQVVPVNDEWSDSAIDSFVAMTHVAQWVKLIARVNRYREQDTPLQDADQRESSTTPGIELYEMSEVRDFNIGHELVRSGYAKFDKPTPGYPSICSKATESVTRNNDSFDFDSSPHTVVDHYISDLHNS